GGETVAADHRVRGDGHGGTPSGDPGGAGGRLAEGGPVLAGSAPAGARGRTRRHHARAADQGRLDLRGGDDGHDLGVRSPRTPAEELHAGVPVRTDAPGTYALCSMSATGVAHREWGDRSGVQDGVHPAAETVGNALAVGRGADNPDPAGDPAERSLVAGL